jgi:hypothetical protein
MNPIHFQLLRLSVELQSDEGEVLDALRYLALGARQPVAPSQQLQCVVRRVPDGFEIRADHVVLDVAPSPEAVRDTLFAYMYDRALAQFEDHVLLRGAVVRNGTVRALIVGETGCGLTTLAVRLLFDGAAVEGEAFALLGSSGVMPLPRRFVLRGGTAGLVPGLAERLDSMPAVALGEDLIHGFDPTEAGFGWEIRGGPIDACVVIEPNHGGESRIQRIGETEMARRVSGACVSPGPAGGDWLRDVVRLLDGTQCWHLVLGRLDDAVDALARAFRTPLE